MKKIFSSLACAALLLPGLFFLPAASQAKDSSVTAEWLENVPNLGRHSTFMGSDAPHKVMVVFSAKESVRDFKVLALSFRDIDQNGKAHFDVRELHALKSLDPGCPLVVSVEFIGSIPNNGISYMDAKGKTHRFTLEQSGKDGSAILAEF